MKAAQTNPLKALSAIERIVSDDFCQDLEGKTIHGIDNPDLKICQEKLSMIYMIAHAENPTHSCHHVHKEWRKVKNEVLKD